MNTKALSIALLTLLATPSAASADTYTWAGADDNFSDPASWTGPAPTPGGSATDQLLFPYTNESNSPTAILDLPAPWTLNTLSFTPDAILPYTIAGVTNSSLFFTGPSPTISAPGSSFVYCPTIAVPIASASNLTILGTLAITQPITFTDPNSQLISQGLLIYTSNTAPIGLGSTLVGNTPDWTTNGAFQWNYAPPSSQPVTLSFGNGPIVFNNGSFILNFTPPANASSVSATLTNPILVRYSGTVGISSSNPLASATLNLSGQVTLGGDLAFTTQNATWTSAAAPTPILLSGTITLDQSAASQGPQFGPASNCPEPVTIAGNIVDDPDPTHTAAYPLELSGSYDYSPGNTFTIAGTANTYSTGSIIEYGVVSVAPNSVLGTGPVTVIAGTLQITSPTNIPIGRKVLISQAGSLALTFDQSPYNLIDPTSQGSLAIDTVYTTPLDMSKLGNGMMTLSTTLDGVYAASSLLPGADHVYRLLPVLGDLPNANLTILNSVLQDYDGVPSQAQLAFVTLAAANSYSGGTAVRGYVYAAAPGALGTGNILIGNPPAISPFFGLLFLSAPNAYAANATVDVYGTLAATGPNGSIPLASTPPILHPGSALILGDGVNNNSNRYPDSMPLNLNSSTLVLRGIGATSETVGSISISGVSTIVLQNPNTGTNTTTLLAPSLTRNNNNAIIFLIPYITSTGYESPTTIPFSPAGANTANFLLTAPPPATHGMVAPWIQTRTQFYDNMSFEPLTLPASFLNYTPSGFALATYTSMPTNGGTGTEIVDANPDDNNAFLAAGPSTSATFPLLSLPAGPNSSVTPTLPSLPAGPNASATFPLSSLIALLNALGLAQPTPVLPQNPPDNAVAINTNTSIYALRTSTNIANGTSSPVTLHILSGGLIIFPNENTILIQPDIDFGSAQAIVNVDTEAWSAGNAEISGCVTAPNGLIKIGLGPLILSNANNQILGPLVIQEGALTLPSLPDPTSATPVIISSNATLSFTNSTVVSRPIQTYNNEYLESFSNAIISVPSGMTLTIAAPITGNADTSIRGGNIVIASPISLANGLSIGADQTLLGTNISCSNFSLYGDLRGHGIITAPQYAQFGSGKISPGNDPGDLASFVIDSASTELFSDCNLQFDLDSSGHSDRLLFTGKVDLYSGNSLNDGVFLSLNFLAPPTGDIYTLLSAASITGAFSSVTGLPNGYSLEYTADSILLIPDSASFTVPEPAAIDLLTLAALPLIQRRRRSIMCQIAGGMFSR